MNNDNIQTSEISLKKLEETLKQLNVPIESFKKLLKCVIDNDFSSMNDPIITTRYKESFLKVEKHIMNIVYQDVYANNKTYESFILFIIQLYSVIDTLVEGRLYIADVSKQNEEIVNIFLESYGFDIYNIFDEESKKEIAENIYYHLRRKGTPEILTTMLNYLGITHFLLVEYNLNKKGGVPKAFTGSLQVDIEGPDVARWSKQPNKVVDMTRDVGGKWKLVPTVLLESRDAKKWNFKVGDINLSDVEDSLWWLDETDLHNLYNNFLAEGF